jgi:hemin uptake protein HemP
MKDSGKKQVLDLVSKANGNDCKPKVYESPQLFGSHNEIQIHHEGELYRIRITRNGKLIMNK